MLLVLLIAACDTNGATVPPRDATPTTPATATPVPTARLPIDGAQRAVADFLNAWISDNYDTMYSLLTINSRDTVTREAFEQAYRAFEKQITLLPDGKAYALASAIHRGDSVEIAYDMTFRTALFGEFTDPSRMIQIAVTNEGWRIGWTPGNIVAEFKDGAVLRISQSQTLRGNIYSRDGEVLADMNGQSIVVSLRTAKYPGNNPDLCFAALATVFPSRSVEQMKRLFGPATGADFIYEIGELSLNRFQEVQADIEANCTLQYANRPTRRYLAGGLAPHVVGYVGPIPAEQVDFWTAKGYAQDALIGIDGIERQYESILAGRGESSLNVVLRGQVIRTLAKQPAIRSQSVYLTLNRKLQEGLQYALKDAFTNAIWGRYAPGAAAVVMDVRTGEILAIASYPDFNVDAFNPHSALPNAKDLIASWQNDPRRPTFNRATLGQYPPGSVFKIVSMIAAADSGKFTMNTRQYCSGIWNGQPIGDRRRTDWIASTAAGRHGSITLKQALAGSCNIYFWQIGWTLNLADPTILPNYARRLGFGAPTGIDGVAESTGQVPDPTTYEQRTGLKWRGSDALNIAIGQGDLTVTPLQIARLIAAVANNGTLWRPQLVKQYGIIGEPSYIAQPTPGSLLDLKPGVLEGVREAMCMVVTNPTIGTAYFVFKDWQGGAVVCGKTGTAESGSGLPHAWFGAYAGKTADEPEIAIAVIVEKSNEGSYIAAPIARRIVELYYDLPITPWPSWYGATSELPVLPGLN